jgi:hypothetical protein
MGMETGSHIPLGIGCTFLIAIVVPVLGSPVVPRMSVVKDVLTIR